MWLYLSAYGVLLGALVNAELERQTLADSTRGPDRPLGSRGVVLADTVAMIDLTETYLQKRDAATRIDWRTKPLAALRKAAHSARG